MYKRILAPVDGSPPSNQGLREALKLAKERDCVVTLLHVVDELIITAAPEAAYDATQLIDSLREAGEEVLSESVEIARRGNVTVDSELVECMVGPAADIIVDRATKWNADLIVLGTHGRRGIRRLVMGSDAEEVVRLSPVPVLLVRAESEQKKSFGFNLGLSQR